LVSNNSSPSFQKLLLKIKTKTGKTKYFLYLIFVFLLSVSILNFGCSSTGAGRFILMEVRGFLNLISYFEDDPLPNPSPSTLWIFQFLENPVTGLFLEKDNFSHH
jgi:hypothetical protein